MRGVMGLTTEGLETEGFDQGGSALKISGAVVILDEVDDVENGEHAGERGGL